MHLGNARTALYAWAYARGQQGEFVLRIEDTDRERSTPETEAGLLRTLEWLGVEWDGSPVRQSERRPRHAEVVEELIAGGRAYRCTCSQEDLEARRQATIAAGEKWTYDGRCRDAGHGPDCGDHTVRLRLPQTGRLEWNDLVLGESGQDVGEIGDRIIRRSDGAPLYHLAVVVDDLDMGITTVIRGADHYNNTPLHVALYQALEEAPPRFAHAPLIVGDGGKKLSKRRDDASVEHYREAGYLPEALCNWLVRLGWSHGDEEEFSREEFVRVFDLASVGKSSAKADLAKLQHLNQHWIKQASMERLLDQARPYLESVAGGPVSPDPELARLLGLLRERSHTLAEMAERAGFWLRPDVHYEEKAARKHLKHAAHGLLEALIARLEQAPEWTEEALEKLFAEVCAAKEVKLGALAQPVRVALTGSSASPGIFEVLTLLGRQRSLARLAEAVHYTRHEAPDA